VNDRSAAFSPEYVAKTTKKAEEGLLAALEWMPYMSDVEGDARNLLAISLEKIDVALGWVREAREQAEGRIIEEATS